MIEKLGGYHDTSYSGVTAAHMHTICQSGCQCWPECQGSFTKPTKKVEPKLEHQNREYGPCQCWICKNDRASERAAFTKPITGEQPDISQAVTLCNQAGMVLVHYTDVEAMLTVGTDIQHLTNQAKARDRIRSALRVTRAALDAARTASLPHPPT